MNVGDDKGTWYAVKLMSKSKIMKQKRASMRCSMSGTFFAICGILLYAMPTTAFRTT